MLAGNKSDLAHGQQVPNNDAFQFASEIGAKLLFTSAKTCEGIHDIFRKAAKMCLPDLNSTGAVLLTSPSQSVIRSREEKKKCCCG